MNYSRRLVSMVRVMGRTDENEVLCLFHWTRRPVDGIGVAWRDARDFGQKLKNIWVEQISTEGELA